MKWRRGWGCNFTRRTLLLLVATFATIILLYNSHTCALILIARRGGEGEGEFRYGEEGHTDVPLYALVHEAYWLQLLDWQHWDIPGSPPERGGGYGCVFFLIFFPFYWINSHHFPGQLFMWWGLQGGHSCPLCVISGAPGASDWRWALPANSSRLSASWWFYL